MKKRKKIIMIFLILLLILLLMGNIILNDKNKKQEVHYLSKNTVIKNYETYLRKQNLINEPLKKLLIRKTKEKEVYQLEKEVYFVIGLDSNDQILEKVYLYIGAENTRIKEFLSGMVESTLSISSKNGIDNIVSKMLTNQKANEFGVVVDFRSNGYEYMTIEKENGTMLNYFIYYDQK